MFPYSVLFWKKPSRPTLSAPQAPSSGSRDMRHLRRGNRMAVVGVKGKSKPERTVRRFFWSAPVSQALLLHRGYRLRCSSAPLGNSCVVSFLNGRVSPTTSLFLTLCETDTLLLWRRRPSAFSKGTSSIHLLFQKILWNCWFRLCRSLEKGAIEPGKDTFSPCSTADSF